MMIKTLISIILFFSFSSSIAIEIVFNGTDLKSNQIDLFVVELQIDQDFAQSKQIKKDGSNFTYKLKKSDLSSDKLYSNLLFSIKTKEAMQHLNVKETSVQLKFKIPKYEIEDNKIINIPLCLPKTNTKELERLERSSMVNRSDFNKGIFSYICSGLLIDVYEQTIGVNSSRAKRATHTAYSHLFNVSIHRNSKGYFMIPDLVKERLKEKKPRYYNTKASNEILKINSIHWKHINRSQRLPCNFLLELVTFLKTIKNSTEESDYITAWYPDISDPIKEREKDINRRCSSIASTKTG